MADLTLDLTKYIDQTFFSGQYPHVRGHRIRVSTIAYHARDNGWNIEELARAFTLSRAEILAALLYYQENRAQIDALESAERARYEQQT